jgi:hypothetical protein
MNSGKISPDLIHSLRRELQTIRQASLSATREGNFRKVARLTLQAAHINKSLMDAEGLILSQM